MVRNGIRMPVKDARPMRKMHDPAAMGLLELGACQWRGPPGTVTLSLSGSLVPL